MPIRSVRLLNAQVIDDDPTTVDANFNFDGVVPKRITFYITVTESGSGSTVTFSLDVSPDNGVSRIDYDKLITDAGVDAPVASVAYAATGDDVVSISPEDVLDYLFITMAGGSTTSSNFYTLSVWMVYSY